MRYLLKIKNGPDAKPGQMVLDGVKRVYQRKGATVFVHTSGDIKLIAGKDLISFGPLELPMGVSSENLPKKGGDPESVMRKLDKLVDQLASALEGGEKFENSAGSADSSTESDPISNYNKTDTSPQGWGTVSRHQGSHSGCTHTIRQTRKRKSQL